MTKTTAPIFHRDQRVCAAADPTITGTIERRVGFFRDGTPMTPGEVPEEWWVRWDGDVVDCYQPHELTAI